jgi:PAS domain S-box-containing protein
MESDGEPPEFNDKPPPGCWHGGECELLASAIEFAVFTFDRDRKILTWSKGAERMFGFSEQETAGLCADVLFTPEDRAAGVPEEEVETAIVTGRAMDERWHLRKNGTRLFASGAVSPVKGSRPMAFVKIARDLTERKLMEDALNDADKRKNEFIATLAHELRNPLAPIRTGLELLKKPATSDEVKTRLLDIMERQMDSVVHLVDDLMEISRITQGKIHLKLEDIDLGEAVHAAVRTCLSPAVSRTRNLKVNVPAHPVWAKADAVRVEQCIVNLLTNAIKFTSDGGTIRVSLRDLSDSAEIWVEDNGEGLPQEMISQVFEMFRQAHDGTGQGLGIGLAVVKSLTELHGGRVDASSEGLGKGSTFKMILPLGAGGEAQRGAGRGGSTDDQALRQTRILVVDDNIDAAEVLRAALLTSGCEVELAFDGNSALTKFEAFAPEVCLCDLGLPDIDGYEVARRIRKTCPSVTLIAISGWGNKNDRERSAAAGFDAHMVKPVKLKELSDLLKRE